MLVAEVKVEFADYCRQYRNHTNYQRHVDLIGERVLADLKSEFRATGNGGGEPWVKVRRESEKRGPWLSIPKRFLRFLEETQVEQSQATD